MKLQRQLNSFEQLALGKTMATEDKKIKADPSPKNKADPAPKKEPPPKDKSASDVKPTKAEGGETVAASPSSYSRGEGQKPVTQAYKDNWNAIFAKKKKKR
jgi:hypothetical protein